MTSQKAYCAPCACIHSIHPKGDELLRHRVAMWTAPLEATEAWRGSVKRAERWEADVTSVREALARRMLGGGGVGGDLSSLYFSQQAALARRLFAEMGET